MKPVSRWPVAGLSEYWLLASSPASKVRTSVHTVQVHNTQYNKYMVQQESSATSTPYNKYIYSTTSTPYNITHGTTSTHKMTTVCNTYSCSTATMVVRTRLNVTFYLHCLYCYRLGLEARKYLTIQLDARAVGHLASFAPQLKQIINCRHSIEREVVWRHGSLVPTEMDRSP